MRRGFSWMMGASRVTLSRKRREWSQVRNDNQLAGLEAAVDGVLVAAVNGERGLERVASDLPHGSFIGVGIAVSHQKPIQEFEQMSWHTERTEGVDKAFIGNRIIEQRA